MEEYRVEVIPIYWDKEICKDVDLYIESFASFFFFCSV